MNRPNVTVSLYLVLFGMMMVLICSQANGFHLNNNNNNNKTTTTTKRPEIKNLSAVPHHDLNNQKGK
jgi:uncharacterized membrane protein